MKRELNGEAIGTQTGATISRRPRAASIRKIASSRRTNQRFS